MLIIVQSIVESLRVVLKTGFIVFSILLLSAAHANTNESSGATRDAMDYFFHQSFNNLQEEAELAREEGKIGIFVMFNDPDCPWCKKMKATIMNQVPVQDFYRKNFRILHVDTRGDTMMTNFDGTELAEKDFAFKVHRVRATPVMMFFDLEGNKLMRLTGATRSVDEFMWLGEFVINGDYKTTKFSRYKREKLKEKKNSANL